MLKQPLSSLKKLSNSQRGSIFIYFIISLTLSLLIWKSATNIAEKRYQETFNYHSRIRITTIQNALEKNYKNLIFFRQFFASSQWMDPKEFTNFCLALRVQPTPPFQLFWNPLVAEKTADSWRSRLIAANFQPTELSFFTVPGTFPGAKPQFALPMLYSWPKSRLPSPFTSTMEAETLVRAILEETTLDTFGLPVRVRITQNPSERMPDYQIILPIYQADITTTGPIPYGFLTVNLNIQTLIDQTINCQPFVGLPVRIYDVTDTEKPQQLAHWNARLQALFNTREDTAYCAPFTDTTLQFFTRKIQCRVYSSPAHWHHQYDRDYRLIIPIALFIVLGGTLGLCWLFNFHNTLLLRERLYHLLYDGIADAIFVHSLNDDDTLGHFIEINQVACKRLGYTHDELLALSPAQIDHPDSKVDLKQVFSQLRAQGKAVFEQVHRAKTGDPIPVEIHSQLFSLENHTSIISIARDIRERKLHENELKQERNLFQTIIDTIPVMITLYDPQINMQYLNKTFIATTGWTQEDASRGNLVALCFPHPQIQRQAIDFMKKCSGEWEDYSLCTRFGTLLKTSWTNIALDDGRQIGIGIDLTSRIEMENQLKSALNEKELLMKEILHRVKNSLSMATGLISLEIGNLKDRQDVEIFKKTQQRICSIANLYEILHQSGTNDLSIPLNSYFDSIVATLKKTTPMDQILQFESQVDPIRFETKTTLALGLILNELITNALKYAFPDKQGGIIHISFKHAATNIFHLVVSDNGVGFPEDFDSENLSSWGINLVKQLVNQLNGTVTFQSQEGCQVKIEFTTEMQ